MPRTHACADRPASLRQHDESAGRASRRPAARPARAENHGLPRGNRTSALPTRARPVPADSPDRPPRPRSPRRLRRRSAGAVAASRAEMPGTASSSASLASRTALQRAEPLEQRGALAGTDPGQLLEDRAQVRLRAQRALELDREAMGLVAHALEQQQPARARRERHGILAARQEDALGLEPARAPHARRRALRVALLGQRDDVLLDPRVASAAHTTASWPLPPSISSRSGSGSLSRLARRRRDHLAQARVVVARVGASRMR